MFWVFGVGLGVPACPPAYRGGLFGGAIKGGGWILLSFLVFEVDALLRGFRRDPPERQRQAR